MIKYFERHYVSTILLISIFLLSLLYPDYEFTLGGSFAWITTVYTLFIILAGIITSIRGGSMSYETVGLISWIKKRRMKK